jgi:hypothetical protein
MRKKSWRDILPIHPAADLFPLMSPEELKVLGEDIKKNGLKIPVTVYGGRGGAPLQLLDGRNRLDAMEAVGLTIRRFKSEVEYYCDDTMVWESASQCVDADPYDYVISANIHRRHLTAEQKRELIAKLITADPSKSDRQVAETVKASPTTVGTVRAKMEASGDVSKLDTRRDRKGRTQLAHKPKPKPAPAEQRKRIAQRIKELQPKASNRQIAKTLGVNHSTVDRDIGANAPPRSKKHNDNNDGRAIDGANAPPPDLSDKQPAHTDELGALLRAWDRASEATRKKFMARAGLQRTPPPPELPDLPAFLDRRGTS